MVETPTIEKQRTDEESFKAGETRRRPGRFDENHDARKPVSRRSRMLVIAALLVLIVGGALVYRHYAGSESTDDAQIDGYISPISSRISGYVMRVSVDDNQFVKAGMVLVEIDPRDYEVALNSARAAYANDLATARAAQVNVPITSANTSSALTTAEADVANARSGVAAAEGQFEAAQAAFRQAQANDAKAQDDVNRYRQLAEKEEISQQQYFQAVTAERSTAAAVEGGRAAALAAQHQVAQARSRLAQAQAGLEFARTGPRQVSAQRSRALAADAAVERAKAAVDQAELSLQYTKIVAPVDGIVGKRSVQVGQNVAPGQQLMQIVPVENIWVTANFKETQLRSMRPGQPARISVDAYKREFNGHVDSIAGASGAVFSLLPPENATGNYVKVVQRIPVKIIFEKGQDPQHLLRPGMSAEPKVRIKQ
jgi:membrane fusion protein, multidrug efflux system